MRIFGLGPKLKKTSSRTYRRLKMVHRGVRGVFLCEIFSDLKMRHVDGDFVLEDVHFLK